MVKMASTLLFGKEGTDIREGINFERMREERPAKARKALTELGIPAILVTGEPNVRYLTGFSWSEFQPFLSYTLFFAEHDPVIFAHAGSYHQMQDQAPWIKDWRIARSWLQGACGLEAARAEAKLFAQEISQEVQDRGLAGEKLGIVGFEDLAREALRQEGLNVVEGWSPLLEASKTKTQDEINCHKMAASICTSGWQRALELLKPGVDRETVAREVREAMAAAGATTTFCGITAGPLSFERIVTHVTRRVEYGDLVYAPLCGTSYLGYSACLYRSFKVGTKPTAKEKDWYKLVKDRVDAAIEATKPGASTADIAKAFPPASRWGYRDEVEVLSVEIGHGIGLVSLSPANVHYNYPVINRQWSPEYPQIIEEGMVISYESLEGEHRVGGVRLENTVVVTKDGAEIIDHFPRDEILVAGEI
jgi:Xaa-Pro aminopeptidase